MVPGPPAMLGLRYLLPLACCLSLVFHDVVCVRAGSVPWQVGMCCLGRGLPNEGE